MTEMQSQKVPPKEFYEMAQPIAQQIHKRKDKPSFAADMSLIAEALYAAFKAGMIQGNCGECGAHD